MTRMSLATRATDGESDRVRGIERLRVDLCVHNLSRASRQRQPCCDGDRSLERSDSSDELSHKRNLTANHSMMTRMRRFYNLSRARVDGSRCPNAPSSSSFSPFELLSYIISNHGDDTKRHERSSTSLGFTNERTSREIDGYDTYRVFVRSSASRFHALSHFS